MELDKDCSNMVFESLNHGIDQAGAENKRKPMGKTMNVVGLNWQSMLLMLRKMMMMIMCWLVEF